MTLPEQLQKQVETANNLITQHYGPKPNADEEGTTGTEAAAPANTEQAPAAPAATLAEPVRPQGTPATPAEDENSETYAQRWRSQQGIVNAANRKLAQAEQRIATLEQLVSSIQAMPASHVPQPAASLVGETDVNEYGKDMIDFARRVAREEMSPIAQALHDLNRRMEQLQGLAPTVQRVAANQQVSAEQSFAAGLSRAVPDWGTINDDPRFHAWLLTPDSMTGITRQTYLADAEQTLDLNRVVSIFQAWKQEAGVTQAPSATDPALRVSNVSKLEKQLAPGRASAATPPPSQKAEKTYTPADISKFFADKLHGLYKGKEAEAVAIERDIFLAQREGRIVQRAA